MKQDIYTTDGALDMQAIELRARQLRADATRNAVLALIAWFKPKSGVAKGTQSA
ncbi:RSP_7527 family protein [Cognatishimia sp. MH4019]|uniref:RSP_7527 family protein n=1 Tax=Cognatishimia sp. MH4019 TaxID=2854030 RepID=UPI001CD2A2E4|nr:hypothetical protein [Cognatishimia sp. MH4019]